MTDTYDEPEEVLHGDVELRDQLLAEACAGRLWDRLAVTLARYGWAVMSAWLDTRVIAQKCREKGRGVELPYDWSAEDREDLVTTAVAHGMEMFRQALLADRWKPERGASLRTYFLGGCVLAFPNVLRHWRAERDRYRKALASWGREMATGRLTVEPVDVVDAMDALSTLTCDETQRDRAISYLSYHDYTPAEIADILGVKPGTVNTALYRIRHRRGQREGGTR
jgi:DNA-directed RNA polymerase specialized sigma24 family protein